MRGSTFRERYGPWALVTGASAGIGAEFARQLAGRGLGVILVARRARVLQALAAGLEREHGVEARTVAVDLTDPAFLDAIRPVVGGVDVGLLVNNAGTAVGGGLLDSDLEAQRRVVALNAVAPLGLAHELGQGMRARGIIFLSSLFALQGVPTFANYAATQSYDLTLADGLAYELRRDGVDVLGVLPGPTLTEGTATMGVEPDRGPMQFGPPDRVVAAALGSLGNRPVVVPGAVNRVMSAVMGRALSRSRRTKVVAGMLSRMQLTGGPSPGRRPEQRSPPVPGGAPGWMSRSNPLLHKEAPRCPCSQRRHPPLGEAGSVLVGQSPSP